MTPTAPPADGANTMPPAAQATAPAIASGDIMVTATRRSERLQDVPIAVGAVDWEQIRARKIDNCAELLKIAPGPTIVPVEGTSIITAQIRGQGTTFGRNAVGGALVITNDVPKMSASLGRTSVTGFTCKGGRGGIKTDGFINVPLSDTITGRFASSVKSVGGYRHNLTTGSYLAKNKVASYRGSLRWQSNEKWNIVASGSYILRAELGDGPTIVDDESLVASVRNSTGGDLHQVLLDHDGYARFGRRTYHRGTAAHNR